jgi:hypothetical protein
MFKNTNKYSSDGENFPSGLIIGGGDEQIHKFQDLFRDELKLRQIRL